MSFKSGVKGRGSDRWCTYHLIIVSTFALTTYHSLSLSLSSLSQMLSSIVFLFFPDVIFSLFPHSVTSRYLRNNSYIDKPVDELARRC